MKRQLAAILYADVAGHSRLTGRNEEQTHQLLNEALTSLSEAISASGGSKVHEAGDAVLAEFPSVTEAVDCAFGFQKMTSTAMGSILQRESRRLRKRAD